MSVHRLHVCTQTTCLYTDYMSVHRLHVCTQTTCLYTDYMCVHRLHVCTQTTCLYTDYMSVHRLHALCNGFSMSIVNFKNILADVRTCMLDFHVHHHINYTAVHLPGNGKKYSGFLACGRLHTHKLLQSQMHKTVNFLSILLQLYNYSELECVLCVSTYAAVY